MPGYLCERFVSKHLCNCMRDDLCVISKVTSVLIVLDFMEAHYETSYHKILKGLRMSTSFIIIVRDSIGVYGLFLFV